MQNDENFELYLALIQQKADKFFNQQQLYIHCKEGCSGCCEDGVYPYSEAEFRYLMKGFESLDENVKKEILSRVEKIKKEKTESGLGNNFCHVCPFLINSKCSVYNNRGIICRVFGLAYFDENEKIKVPNCINRGFNYAEVYDQETGMFSSELFEKTGYTQEPLAYNVSLKFLLKNDAVKELGIDFGEEKALIDWF